VRIDLHNSTFNLETAVPEAAKMLLGGGIAVLPTETVYGLAARASDEQAVHRLVRLKGRSENNPMALAISGLKSLSEFVSDMSGLANRLARRCLPGPVSIVLKVPPQSEFFNLPEYVQKLCSKDGFVSFRVPQHFFTFPVLQKLDEPLVLTSANRSGEKELTDINSLASVFGNEVDFIADDGDAANKKPSTVVKIDGENYSILRQGAVSAETIQRLTAKMILFVCTGNTCRSPMAERICEKLLAEHFHCSPDELERFGYVVLSAGLAAGSQPASQNAIEVLADKGIDLSNHCSQLLRETHVRYADYIFTMTRAHRETILSAFPDADTCMSVLRIDGGDVADPFGGSLSEYQMCAAQIESEIAKRLKTMGLHK